MRKYFTLLIILMAGLNIQAQKLNFSIHFKKNIYPYFIQIQKGTQKEKQKIDIDQSDVSFQLEDTLTYFTLWVEGTSLRIPLFQKDVEVSLHLMYPVASITTNDKMLNNWLSVIRIKKEIQDQLKLNSLTADTSQYVALFEDHWSYYKDVLDQCYLQHSNMEPICTAEKKWLKEQKANNWKKQKYRMGVNYRRLSFRERMRKIVGTEALNIKAITQNGDSVELANFRGKPIVIDFWATWCGPCKQEKPYWKNMEEKFGDQVNFISIGVKSPQEKWFSEAEVSSEIHEWFIDKKEEHQLEPWNVYFIPRYVLINKNFKVVNTDLKGPSTRAFEMEIQKAIH